MERPPHVVLVGIDEYKNACLDNLHHAVKDTLQWNDFLLRHLGCTPQHICTLHNSQATRSTILSKLHSHLIHNIDIHYGDPMIIVFAGHGTCHLLDPSDEEGDVYQAICPFDSGIIDDDGKEVEDIKDTLLGEISLELAKAKGDNIVWVLDCCCSGSGTRHRHAMQAFERVRRFAPQVPNYFPSEQPVRGAPITLRSSTQPPVPGCAVTHTSVDPRFPSLQTHMLLSACREDETARDGWFTGRLVSVMKACLPDILAFQFTYSDLYAHLAEDCNVAGPHPQLEGKNKDRAVFSTRTIDVRRELVPANVNREDRKNGVLELRIAAGDAHNVGIGAQFHLWPTRLRVKSGDPRFNHVGQAVVTQVNATDCLAFATLVDPSQRLQTCMFAGMICTKSSRGVTWSGDIFNRLLLDKYAAVDDASVPYASSAFSKIPDSFRHSNPDHPFSDVKVQLLRMNPDIPSIDAVKDNPQLNLIEESEENEENEERKGYLTAKISNEDYNYVFRLFNPSNDSLHVAMQLCDPDRGTVSEMYTSPSSWCPSVPPVPLSSDSGISSSRKFTSASSSSALPTLRRASSLTVGDPPSGVEPFKLGLDEKGKRREGSSDFYVKITVATSELSTGMGMVTEPGMLAGCWGNEQATHETTEDILEVDSDRPGLHTEKRSPHQERERRKWDTILVLIHVANSFEV